eukprot:7389929-Prymnesium_polylepis.2
MPHTATMNSKPRGARMATIDSRPTPTRRSDTAKHHARSCSCLWDMNLRPDEVQSSRAGESGVRSTCSLKSSCTHLWVNGTDVSLNWNITVCSSSPGTIARAHGSALPFASSNE